MEAGSSSTWERPGSELFEFEGSKVRGQCEDLRGQRR
jgi:hypothetical protein